MYVCALSSTAHNAHQNMSRSLNHPGGQQAAPRYNGKCRCKSVGVTERKRCFSYTAAVHRPTIMCLHFETLNCTNEQTDGARVLAPARVPPGRARNHVCTDVARQAPAQSHYGDKLRTRLRVTFCTEHFSLHTLLWLLSYYACNDNALSADLGPRLPLLSIGSAVLLSRNVSARR